MTSGARGSTARLAKEAFPSLYGDTIAVMISLAFSSPSCLARPSPATSLAVQAESIQGLWRDGA